MSDINNTSSTLSIVGGFGVIFEDEKILALVIIGVILALAGLLYDYYHTETMRFSSIGKTLAIIIRRIIFGSIVMTTIFFTIVYYYPTFPIIAVAGISGLFSYFAEDVGSMFMTFSESIVKRSAK